MSDLSLRVIIRAVTDQFTTVINQVRHQLQHLAQAGSEAAAQISTQFNTLRQSINTAFGGLQGLMATLGLGAIANDILDTNRAMEGLRVQLVSVAGSVDKANSVFNDMLKLATETPFEIQDVTKAYIMLKNFGLEPTAKVMDALTNQVSKLGGSADTLNGVTLALGQAWGKGKLQAQDINQMVERGVPVYDLLSQVTGKNAEQLQKMSDAGELTRDILEKLIAKMGEMASGSNARAMETLNGKISVLADSWHKFEDALLQDKSEGAIKHIVSTWGEWLDVFTEQLNDTSGKLAQLSALNERIATRKTVIQFFETDPVKASLLGAATGTTEAGEKNRLAADIAERNKLLVSINEERAAQQAANQAETDRLATSKKIAEQDSERIKKAELLAEWSKKYASQEEKLASELAQAKKDLGADFTPALEQAIIAKFTTVKTGIASAQKALIKSQLDDQLAALKTQQDALKTASELNLQDQQNATAQKALALRQQRADELISETQLQSQLLALKKAQAQDELTLKRELIERTAALEKAAIDAKLHAKQSEAPAGNYDALITATQQKYQLPDGLLRAVIQRESSFNPNAVSSAGAQGLMGLMPNTAKGLGVTDAFNVEQNIDAGAKHLKQLLVNFKGDLNQALMAYNAGETRVRNTQGDTHKLARETQDYPGKVLAEMHSPTPHRQGNATEQHTFNTELKTLYAEREAIEADKNAKLKALEQTDTANQLNYAQSELEITTRVNQQTEQLNSAKTTADTDAALSELDAKTTASEQELALGNITQAEHLANLRQFAQERLQIEIDLLDAKRHLLGADKLALAQNLYAKEALVRGYNATQKNLDNKEAQDKKAAFKDLFQPFETAMDGMVQGVLSGQQTISNAVKHAAASILTSYAATFIKTRIMSAAEWAWEVAGFGTKEGKIKAIKEQQELWDALQWIKKKALLSGQWLWSLLGFAKTEAVKTEIKAAQSTAQVGICTAEEALKTGAVATGEAARETIEDTANAKSSIKTAWRAAKGAFASVMDAVPFPFNVVLAPIAGAAAFAGTMALGSAKGGEWQVDKDGSPYILHEKESVLPAGVADNFRKVVNLVQGSIQPVEPVSLTLNRLFATGQLPRQLGLPDHLTRLTHNAQATANQLVKERVRADNARQTVLNSHKTEATTINLQGIMLSPEDFLQQHGKTIVKVAQKQARNFNTGKKS